MKNLIQTSVITLFYYLISIQLNAQSQTYLGVPVTDIEKELKTHLSTWYPRIIDTENGGYWTNFEYDWTRSQDQNKMLVTQARGLWTAARAASAFPDDPVYKKAADHGFEFLTKKMWDISNGGFYQYYPINNSEPSYKLIYGNTFALFALAEYAKVNKSPEVMMWVNKVFQWMETVAHDPKNLGYYNIIIPDNVKNSKDPEIQAFVSRLGWGKPDWKDQNTSIHILEAFTTVYQVLPEPLVKKRLEEMLKLVRDKMVNRDGHLNLYFTNNWEPIVYRDSSRAFIMKNLPIDHVSFGHDIETAYLLLDASKALYGKYDKKTLQVAKRLVDHSLQYGFEKEYYGLFDRGYRFTKNGNIEIVTRSKAWWAQMEAWHSLALMANLYPKEKIYPEAFQKMWQYMQKELIDHEHKGLYGNGLDESPESKTQRKAHQWKGAYHDGRALMQVWEYTKERRRD
ncbi:MAG: AGE family epimerase/isomerase [Saprospiraceae bacterium]